MGVGKRNVRNCLKRVLAKFPANQRRVRRVTKNVHLISDRPHCDRRQVTSYKSYRLQATGYKLQAASCSLQACKLQATGCRPQSAGCKPQATSNRSATSHRLQASGYKLQARSIMFGVFPQDYYFLSSHAVEMFCFDTNLYRAIWNH